MSERIKTNGQMIEEIIRARGRGGLTSEVIKTALATSASLNGGSLDPHTQMVIDVARLLPSNMRASLGMNVPEGEKITPQVEHVLIDHTGKIFPTFKKNNGL